MRKLGTILTGMVLTGCLVLSSVTPVQAASSGSWSVKYIPNAPTQVSKQTVVVSVAYDSDGYIANCTKITGQNGRRVKISSNSAGGMNTVQITATGKTKKWKMNKSTKKDVQFIVSAVTGYECTSTGVIKINN